MTVNVLRRFRTSYLSLISAGSLGRRLPAPAPEAGLLSDSLTAGVGTALYRAPECEQLRGAPRGSADKADMYSFGVILFEMIHRPFATGMERVLAIGALREHGLPPSDAVADSDNLRRMVEMLVQAAPDARPSASELLQSPLLPLRVGIDKTYLKEVLDALVTGGQEVTAEIIGALFRRPVDRSAAQAFDSRALNLQLRMLSRPTAAHEGSRARGWPTAAMLKHQVENHLAKTFELYGAIR